MKFYESHFEDYVKTYETNPIQKNIDINIKSCSFDKLNNLIIYGPAGVGKYSQTLSLIKNFSLSKLKYEKKMAISFNKNNYYFKISDIHYEIDMSLLGCNSKLLWHEIYNQIVDIISAKNDKNGIILCKYFHEIHTELLEIFYSYMQQLYNNNIRIKFIILTQDLSFLPDNILNCCQHIKIPRPSRCNYNKCLKIKMPTNEDISLITNIKDLKNDSLSYLSSNKKSKNNYTIIETYKILCDTIIDNIIDFSEMKFIALRDMLYDICIFDMNITNCIWYILQTLIEKEKIDNDKLSKILIETFNFFKLYNNNYRPIYHLEKYILYIISTIHEL
tara:strand:- start:3601 stop:4596 length:996 start_codon:yes stop_codon:yes gene_type:complete